MHQIIFKNLAMALIVAFVTSCLSNADIQAKWKTTNDTYFSNMKDSTGWVNYIMPGTTDNYYYKIITPGIQTGNSPLASDVVSVNYKGSLISGVVFDKTYSGISPVNDPTATPAKFYVNYLIPGFVDNLKHMKVGEIRSIVLPQQLGYGSIDNGVIPPYSVTKFDIQLISIN